MSLAKMTPSSKATASKATAHRARLPTLPLPPVHTRPRRKILCKAIACRQCLSVPAVFSWISILRHDSDACPQQRDSHPSCGLFPDLPTAATRLGSACGLASACGSLVMHGRSTPLSFPIRFAHPSPVQAFET